MQVSMKVNNSKLSVSTQTLDFGTSSSGAEKLFTIGNTGGGTLKWTVSVPKEVDWLSLRKTNGSDSKTISGSDDEKITATIGKDNMDAGTYAGSIAITSNGGNATINVSMVVGPPAFSISKTSFDFGSSTTSDKFRITNTGEGSLTWSATESLAWLSVSRRARSWLVEATRT